MSEEKGGDKNFSSMIAQENRQFSATKMRRESDVSATEEKNFLDLSALYSNKDSLDADQNALAQSGRVKPSATGQ